MPTTQASSDAHARRTWRDVVAALEGQSRFPLTGVASKVLSFLLESAAGCDGRITAEGLEIRFGGLRVRRPRFYSIDVAPALLSQLLAWGGVERGGARLRLAIGPEVVERSARLPFFCWWFDRRRVWIDRLEDAVSLAVRDGSRGDLAPGPWPAPVIETAPVLARPKPAGCPRCGVRLELRSPSGDILACRTCGESFDLPNQSWTRRSAPRGLPA